MPLEKGSICFTYCQVPVVYTLATENSLTAIYKNNTSTTSNQLNLDARASREIFGRTGAIVQINVQIRASALR